MKGIACFAGFAVEMADSSKEEDDVLFPPASRWPFPVEVFRFPFFEITPSSADIAW